MSNATIESRVPAYLYEEVIDYDAQAQGYGADDVRGLIERASRSSAYFSVVVILRNAHYLTTQAFVLLHEYLQAASSRVMIVLVSADKSRIFPPLLDFVFTA